MDDWEMGDYDLMSDINIQNDNPIHDKVIIDDDEYKELCRCRDWLMCLEEAGVDNWDGISYAHDVYDKLYRSK